MPQIPEAREYSSDSENLQPSKSDSENIDFDWDERKRYTEKIDQILPKHSFKKKYTSTLYSILLRHRGLQLITSYAIVCILIMTGGYVFHKCEYTNYEHLLSIRQTLSRDVDAIILKYGISDEEIATLREWHTNKTLDFNPWRLKDATYFAFQIVSTVGYGFWMPLTFAGQFVVVIYGTPGIVLFLICCFHYSVTWFGVIFDYASYISRRTNVLKLEWVNEHIDTDVNKTNMFTILTFYMFQYIVLTVFYAVSYPSWTAWEAIYFVFISGSTIGMSHIYPDIEWSMWAGGLIFHCYLMNLGMCLTLFQRLELMVKNHMQQSHDNIVLIRLQELEREKLESKTNDVLEILQKLQSSKKMKRMSAKVHEVNYSEAKLSLQLKIETVALKQKAFNRTGTRLSTGDALKIARGSIPLPQENMMALSGMSEGISDDNVPVGNSSDAGLEEESIKIDRNPDGVSTL